MLRYNRRNGTSATSLSDTSSSSYLVSTLSSHLARGSAPYRLSDQQSGVDPPERSDRDEGRTVPAHLTVSTLRS